MEGLLEEAIDWMARYSTGSINAKRRTLVEQIQEADRRQRAAGAVEEWFASADQEIRQVSGNANGYLFEHLLRQLDYHDVACVDLLREGFPFPPCYFRFASLALCRRNHGWKIAVHRQWHACGR